jgi:hypothetical protein
VIVRILGEGQLEVDSSVTAELNALDAELEAAVNSGNEQAFKSALGRLLARVRAAGQPLDPGRIEPSELIIPGEDASMDDVRKLLGEEGLIPG